MFREVNKPSGGFLLQVSPANALVSLPGLAYYCAPRHSEFNRDADSINPSLTLPQHCKGSRRPSLLVELGPE